MALSWSKAPKDPGDVSDYTINWAADIGDLTITSSEWSITTGDVVKVEDDNTDTTATIRVSGGTVATSPNTLHNHVILSDGQERDIDALLYIKERLIK